MLASISETMGMGLRALGTVAITLLVITAPITTFVSIAAADQPIRFDQSNRSIKPTPLAPMGFQLQSSGNPDPSFTQRDLPNEVELGNSFEVTVEVDNNGGPGGHWSTIALLFPDLDEGDDDEQLTIVSDTFDDYENIVTEGTPITHKDGSSVDAEYAMAEAGYDGTGSWDEGAAHSVTVDVEPEEVGEFTVYLRGTITDEDNVDEKFNVPESSSTTDHQGYSVDTHTVEVIDDPTVSTDHVDSISSDDATLHGTLDSTGNDETEVYFRYREKGDSNWQETFSVTYSSAGSFSMEADGLDQGTTYEYRAVAENSAGSFLGPIAEFTTESPDPEPDFDGVSISTSEVQRDGSFTVSVDVDNDGGRAGAWSTISMSFPKLIGSDDHQQVEIVSHDFGDYDQVTAPDGEIRNRHDETIFADYVVAEAGTGGDGTWEAGEEHSLTVRVSPSRIGEFPILIRGTLTDDADVGEKFTVPENGDRTDQQDFQVREETVDVIVDPGPPTITAISPQGTTSTVGREVTLEAGAETGSDGYPQDAGDASDLRFTWKLNGNVIEESGPDTTQATVADARDSIDVAFDEAGEHTISLTVTDTVTGQSTTETRQNAFVIEPAIVEGTVTHEAFGEPIEHATIEIAGEAVLTEADGTYSIPVATAGTHTLQVSAPGFENTSTDVTVDSPAGGTLTHDTQLAANPSTVSFTVQKKGTIAAFDWFSGEPLPNATVAFAGEEQLTDSEGRATFENVPAGEYEYTIEKEGYATLTDTESLWSGISLEISAGLIRENAGLIEFNVTGNDGRTLAPDEYRVFVDDVRREPNVETHQVIVDAGTHTIRVEPTDPAARLQPVERSVSVSEGTRRVVDANLATVGQVIELTYEGETYEAIQRTDNKIEVRDSTGDLVDVETARDVLTYLAFTEHTYRDPEHFRSLREGMVDRAQDLKTYYWASHLNEAGIELLRIVARVGYGDYTGAATEGIEVAEHLTRLMDEQLDNDFTDSMHSMTETTGFVYDMVYGHPSKVWTFAKVIGTARTFKRAGDAADWSEALVMAETTTSGEIRPSVAGLVIDGASLPLNDAEAGLKVNAQQNLAAVLFTKTQAPVLHTLETMAEKRERGTINRTEMYGYYAFRHHHLGATARMSNLVANLQEVGNEQSVLFTVGRVYIASLLTGETVGESARESKELHQRLQGENAENLADFNETVREYLNHSVNIHGEAAAGTPLEQTPPLHIAVDTEVRPNQPVTITVESGQGPVENARVTVDGTTTLTDRDGQITWTPEAEGLYTITAEKNGYEADETQTQARPIEVDGKLLTPIEVGRLTPDQTVTETMTIENPVDQSLEIAGVSSSHRGVMAELSSTTIAPDESTTLTVTVDAASFEEGVITEEVVIDWSTPDAETGVPVGGEVYVDNSPPSVVAIAPAVVEVGDSFTIDAGQSSDPDGDPLSFVWEVLEAPDDASVSAPSGSGGSIEASTPGAYRFGVTGSDGTTTDSAEARVLVNDVPSLTIDVPDGPVATGQPIDLSASVEDQFGDVSLVWRLSDDRKLTGRQVSPTFDAGETTVRLIVQDEYGATTKRTFTVQAESDITPTTTTSPTDDGPTPTTTEPPGPGPTTTAPDGNDSDDNLLDEVEAEAPGQPGFGGVVMLLAFVFLALLARRSQG